MPELPPLERVYAATTPEELADAYAAWAAGYDRETAELGYCLPFLIPGWLARHLKPGAGPVLDAGCGTGLTGPCLKALGYDDVEGLDMSPDMLAIAQSRDAYRVLERGTLGGPLPWPDDHFAGFVSAGVFTAGHAPAAGLHELVRITRPGGFAVFTVRDVLLDTAGFRATFDALRAAGRWRSVEESPPFRAFAIAEPEVLVQSFVFEVL
ncbi:class I SAM-dependent methyltransferase [Aquibium sp. ELW1220]|uniref:class I SAM-dependent DNA methyltransferase n=1 Tax=Aquibium sp. ELW1220 TaxID=2976766 RepID=UPI0025B23D6F|nr:class I SAM-dependent methyltransferase [Aquibium sp. ELW1220]MDN2582581.1 class I SAM-dependent methyltransferase [Aquibium sp. ELW1220]